MMRTKAADLVVASRGAEHSVQGVLGAGWQGHHIDAVVARVLGQQAGGVDVRQVGSGQSQLVGVGPQVCGGSQGHIGQGDLQAGQRRLCEELHAARASAPVASGCRGLAPEAWHWCMT